MADFPPPTEPVGAPASSGPVFTLSPWSKRALARLIDGGIAVGIYLVAIILDAILGGTGIVQFVGILGLLGFEIWQLVQQGQTGQTIGKNIIGIKLVKEADAQVLGPGLSVGRAFLHVVDWLPCYIGYLFPLWDPKRQTFADKILQTVVIDA